jgi:hypothetical protein
MTPRRRFGLAGQARAAVALGLTNLSGLTSIYLVYRINLDMELL